MQEEVIKNIASEALKPVSSVIDALLAPKLKRLRHWAEKKDIENRLEGFAIDRVLDNYYRRLLRRICGVSTIVFPQQLLPLTQIYEPLKLTPKRIFAKSKRAEHEFNVQMLKKEGNFLIIDSAGMGKSTFAKHLILEILQSTNKIPIFLELRSISEGETLLDKLSSEIDEYKIDLDENILKRILEMGNCILVLDGYDEMPYAIQAKIAPEIENLASKYDKNNFILTTRPEIRLPEIPDSIIYGIEPLGLLQAKSLVHRYDKVANIVVGKNLIKEFNNIPRRFLQTPLLLALLYRTYGFNQSIAKRISTFYDEIFNALYKGHDLTKSGFAREKSSQLDVEDFRGLLRGLSFLLSAQEIDNIRSESEAINYINNAIKITSVKPISAALFFEDLIKTVPLIVKDGTNYRFLHKSIREFFAGEFIAYQPSSVQIINCVTDGHLSSRFSDIFEYIADINPCLFRRVIAAPLAEKILQIPDFSKLDCLIQSLLFLGDFYIGLWPRKKYIIDPMSKGKKLSLPLNDRFTSISYFYGFINNEQYVFTIASDKRPINIPFSAWELVTIELHEIDTIILERFSNGSRVDENDFRDLENILPKEKWLSLQDIHSLDLLKSSSIFPIFIMFLTRLQFNFTSLTKSKIKPRVIDKNSCNKLLQQVQKENDAQTWLQDFISGIILE